jgi:hypothetical protein
MAHNRFDPSLSDTYEPGEDSAAMAKGDQLQYGTGRVDLQPGRDSVMMGKVALPKHEFATSTHQTAAPFEDLPLDGIAGLGREPGSLFEGFRKAYPHAPGVMGFYFSDDRQHTGTMALGGVDTSHVAPGERVQWFSMPGAEKRWGLRMEDIYVDKKPLHLCPKSGCDLLVDTGSSLVTGPPAGVDKVWSLIGEKVRCDGSNTGPQVDIAILGEDGKPHHFPLDPSQYVVRPDEGECQMGFGKLSFGGKGTWVLGSSFLRRFYSIFDEDKNRIGFVKSLHAPEAAGPVEAAAVVDPVAFLWPGGGHGERSGTAGARCFRRMHDFL